MSDSKNVTGTLARIFFAGVLLGTLPGLVHGFAYLFGEQVTSTAFLADILLLGMAMSVGGLMSGTKLLAFDKDNVPAGTIILLISIIVIEIVLFALAYSAVLFGSLDFTWKHLLYSGAALLVFSIVPFIIEVKYTAKTYSP